MMFIGIILIGVLIYFLLKNQNISIPNNNNSSMSALDIAKTRLAKGEITQEEFAEIKKNLE